MGNPARNESTEVTKATPVLMKNAQSNQHQKQSSRQSSNAKDNIKDISINILNNQRRSPSTSTSTQNNSRKSLIKRAPANENQSKENNRLLRKENNSNLKNPLNEKKLSKL